LHRSLRRNPTLRHRFVRRSCRAFARFAAPPRPPFTRTATLLGALRTSLFGARYRLPTSATAYDVRALSPSSRFPRRDEGLDLLPFLTHHAGLFELPRTAVTRGEPRKRPIFSDPGAGSSRFRGLARPRYRIDRATLPEKAFASSWTGWHDVHGSLDRAKDVSSKRRRVGLRTECVRLCARRRRSPPAASRGHPLSPVRPLDEEETSPSEVRTGLDPRSGGTPRRLPASRGPGCLPPLQRESGERSVSSSGFRVAPSLTPPTRYPQGGDRCFGGHCKRRCRDEPCSDFERAGRLCYPLECRAWA